MMTSARVVPMFIASEHYKTTQLIAVVNPDNDGLYKVEYLYKGNVNIGETIKVDTITMLNNGGDISVAFAISEKCRLLLFLVYDEKSKQYRFTNIDYAGFLVGAVRPKEWATPEEGVEDELLLNVVSDDVSLVDDAIRWITLLNCSRGISALNKFANEKDAPVAIQSYILSKGIETGKREYIEKSLELMSVLDKRIDECKEKKNNALAWRWANIKFRLILSFRLIRYTDDIPYLGSLISSANVDVARLLLLNARYWSDYTTIPHLINVLHKVDDGGQYDALLVLSRLTGRKLVKREIFIKERAQIVAEWIEWWKNEGW